MEYISSLDWSPLWISLKTGIVAAVISFVLGTEAARRAMYLKSRGKKAFLDGLLTLPMVLPPTAAGFFLLLIFSRRRPVGIFLYEQLGIKVVQSWLGCIVAATVITMPLMYRSARAAFEQLDINLVHAARTLGMSERSIFWRVIMPTAYPGLRAGFILSFMRGMGEYGATSMLAGNIPGKTATISQKIAMVIQDQSYGQAGFWVMVMLVMALIVLYILHRLSKGEERGRVSW